MSISSLWPGYSTASCMTSKVPVPVGGWSGHSVVVFVAADVRCTACSFHYSLV